MISTGCQHRISDLRSQILSLNLQHSVIWPKVFEGQGLNGWCWELRAWPKAEAKMFVVDSDCVGPERSVLGARPLFRRPTYSQLALKKTHTKNSLPTESARSTRLSLAAFCFGSYREFSSQRWGNHGEDFSHRPLKMTGRTKWAPPFACWGSQGLPRPWKTTDSSWPAASGIPIHG